LLPQTETAHELVQNPDEDTSVAPAPDSHNVEVTLYASMTLCTTAFKIVVSLRALSKQHQDPSLTRANEDPIGPATRAVGQAE
jgi:hypothetical protein